MEIDLIFLLIRVTKRFLTTFQQLLHQQEDKKQENHKRNKTKPKRHCYIDINMTCTVCEISQIHYTYILFTVLNIMYLMPESWSLHPKHVASVDKTNKYDKVIYSVVGRIAQSVQRPTTGWTVRDRKGDFSTLQMCGIPWTNIPITAQGFCVNGGDIICVWK